MKLNIAKAAISDADEIYSILLPYSEDGIILKRSAKDIEKNINHFFVAKINNSIIGVISYYHYSNLLLEIRSLAVKKGNFKRKIGSELLKRLINSLLKDFPGAKIFALTYKPGFFKKSGFKEVPKDSLPEKIWKDCRLCLHQENCGETALIYHEKQTG